MRTFGSSDLDLASLRAAGTEAIEAYAAVRGDRARRSKMIGDRTLRLVRVGSLDFYRLLLAACNSLSLTPTRLF
jgi:hypothetical protein